MGKPAFHTDRHRVAAYHNYRVDGWGDCTGMARAALYTTRRDVLSRSPIAWIVEYIGHALYFFESGGDPGSGRSFGHDPTDNHDRNDPPCNWIVCDFGNFQLQNERDHFISVHTGSYSQRKHRRQ